ncbi:MAG TPA: hypothetical protein VGS22_18465 [Thermoanaerobaculia bacterium]|jgi:hypothetical protein|nr:hypothetical protein [Thermoanaerobaculia bacterium]
MFVGHYAVSFAAKRMDRTIPLWVLFLATQFLDILWAPCILLGIEKVRIAPGTTASNPLDLYYMPYTHGLVAAALWSCAAATAYQLIARPANRQTSAMIGFAVFSHWILDFVDHRPDLPCTTTPRKSAWGFGILPRSPSAWKPPCSSKGSGSASEGTSPVFFGPPPTSDRAAAWTALIAYSVFAAVIWWLQDRRAGTGAVGLSG